MLCQASRCSISLHRLFETHLWSMKGRKLRGGFCNLNCLGSEAYTISFYGHRGVKSDRSQVVSRVGVDLLLMGHKRALLSHFASESLKPMLSDVESSTPTCTVAVFNSQVHVLPTDFAAVLHTAHQAT